MGNATDLTSDEPYVPDEESEEILEATSPKRDCHDRNNAAPNAAGAFIRPPGCQRIDAKSVANFMKADAEGKGGKGGKERRADTEEVLEELRAKMFGGGDLDEADMRRIVTVLLLDLASSHRPGVRMQATRGLGELAGLFKRVQVNATPQGLVQAMRDMQKALGEGPRTIDAED